MFKMALNFRSEKESSKRLRTNSGNKPLSSINDIYDPLDILSAEKAEDSQVFYKILFNKSVVPNQLAKRN